MPSFLILAAIWGSSFALIKVAVEAGMAPVWVAFWRCFFGAVMLWLLLAVARGGVPRDLRLWGHAFVVGILFNSVPFTLIAYGETQVTSVLAGILNASTPLFALLVGLLALPDERPDATRLVALAVGFGGVLVVLGVWRGVGEIDLAGSLAILGATFGYGLAFSYIRRTMGGRPESGTTMATAQVTCSTVQLAVAAPVLSGSVAWPGTGAAVALVALGALGTGVAYVLNFTVIRRAGATVASTVTYVAPVFATAIGVLLLSEPVSWNTIVGGLLVVAGVALQQLRRPTRQTRPQLEISAD